MTRWGLLCCMLLVVVAAFADPVTLTMTVDKFARTALVYPGIDAQKVPSPVVLVFHGFLSNSRQTEMLAHIEKEWPEATVVYPQGLNVYLAALRATGPGWQSFPGDLGDRDLHFVDALLLELGRRYQVDARRVYATGISDGAIFTYQLFGTRAKTFAAFAPVAGWEYFLGACHVTTPRPFIIIQGANDRLVKPKMAEAARDEVKRINRCGEQTVEWAPGYLSYQPCASAMPVIWHLWDGGHWWPNDATQYIVKFFKEHALPEQ